MNVRKKITIATALSLFAHIATANNETATDNTSGETHVRAVDEKSSKAGTALKHYLASPTRSLLKTSSTIDRLPYTRIHDGKILLDITTYGNAKQVLDELTAQGLTHGAFFYKQISGYMPIEKIDVVLSHPGVRFATASQFKTRATTSQGDIAMGTDVARITFGVDGSGIKIGTISDSFDATGGAAADIASGDLPDDVTVLKDDPMGTDEGRAMVQIVHDIAPGAQLFFRSAAFGEADFAVGIREMALMGIHILDDDIFYFSEPMFQDGMAAQAAAYAVDVGTHYFSAAGNTDELSYEAPFRDSGLPPPPTAVEPSLSGVAHDFDPDDAVVDITQTFVLEPNDNLSITFQWPQPFVSACEGDCPGPNTDFDLGLYDPIAMTYVAVAKDDNLMSGAPLEILTYVNNTLANQTLELVIVKRIGPVPEPNLIKYIEVSGISPSEFDVKSATSFGHANGDKVIAVGSASWFNVPPESDVPFVNNSSSTAGIPIFFDTKNQLLPTPIIRQNPDVTGPDGGNNTFFGNDSAQDSDSLPNFFGTSAATPHVAGLAGLILENARGKISPAQMEAILETTALDIPDPAVGFDFKSGHGLVQAAGDDGAVCADIDNDGFCINADACVDDANKTRIGRCGCNVAEGTCKLRRGAGSGGHFVPSYRDPLLAPLPPNFDDISAIAPENYPSPTSAQGEPKAETPKSSASSNHAPAPIAPLVPASSPHAPDEETSSCTTASNPSDALLFGLFITAARVRQSRRRRS